MDNTYGFVVIVIDAGNSVLRRGQEYKITVSEDNTVSITPYDHITE